MTKHQRYARSEKGAKRDARRYKKTGHVAGCLSKEEWLALYNAQDGCCALCGDALRNRYEPKDESPGATAALDHDHRMERWWKSRGYTETEALRMSTRGLLCSYKCNRLALTKYWDLHPERLLTAYNYLTAPPARRILKLDAGN